MVCAVACRAHTCGLPRYAAYDATYTTCKCGGGPSLPWLSAACCASCVLARKLTVANAQHPCLPCTAAYMQPPTAHALVLARA